MGCVGIVCEYNPFHNGHLYHINEIKKMFPNDLIILVLSGNVTQRGELSILSKWDKTQLALNYGIDLVVELPYLFASQSADTFAYGALKILNELKVDKIIFGSEIGHIEPLIECAKTQLFSKKYQKKVSTYLKEGLNYPTALAKALKEEVNFNITTPNDLLGLGYIKEIIKNNYNITPITIKRTNNYHDKNLTGHISSATSIRNHLLNNEDIKNTIPKEVLAYLDKPLFLKDFFPFIKYKIITENTLTIYEDIDINLANRFKEKIKETETLEQFINKVKTKYYTYNRLMRACSHLLFNFTKKDNNKNNIYIRVLGFTVNGQLYLNKIKKDITIPLISNYANDKNNLLDLELRVTRIISLIKGDNFINEEIKHKPIIKKF